jgi:MFS family permease
MTTVLTATRAVGHGLREYGARLRLFRPNARLYLANLVITGVAMGVFRLIFNFFVLARGFDETLLGSLVTINSLTSLIVALPMGYLADVLGRKRSLLLAGGLTSASIALMVVVPSVPMLYAANVLFGVSQSLAAVTKARS